ncbi:T9SS type A sorting domain-containing protein [uncultured Dokdonia sp.]|uniref:T9SS type A sorting domain-containing protein n=1 Tax=uncultured Dokdonia sp. TaxID=575653 RepID=UPI0026295E63|nr:T9SS type A sorting domain-containing protein [uncultured Dokdonia sp.]
MKLIYFIFLLVFPFSLLAQEDLNRTWFLTELTVDGNAINIPNEEGQDGYPTLSILINDAEGQVEGIGICNSFLSSMPISTTETMITLDISHTLVFCETQEEIDFEFAYFNFLGTPESQDFNYSIAQQGDFSIELVITKSNGDTAVYSSTNPNIPENLTQEPWYLDYFEIDGVAQNYPTQQDGQLNDYSISYFETGAELNQGYICFYGGGGTYSAFNYFGTQTISISYLAQLAMDCGVEILNNYDGAFTTQLEGKTHTYEIIEEGQGRRLILTDTNGDRIFYTNAFLGTEEFTQVAVELFPNPSSDKLTITGEEIDRIQSYQIIDIQGRVVSKNTFTITIDVESLATGMYFLKLQGIQTETTHRFIKK